MQGNVCCLDTIYFYLGCLQLQAANNKVGLFNYNRFEYYKRFILLTAAIQSPHMVWMSCYTTGHEEST